MALPAKFNFIPHPCNSLSKLARLLLRLAQQMQNQTQRGFLAHPGQA
jgi:hypothetical protein